ncbi:MAG: L-2-amino-thiazoline-4-carboxylic acid hydrolase [Gemmatimonadota bacterium]
MEPRPNQLDRRGFLHGIVPACAVTCMALRAPLGPVCSRSLGTDPQEAHKWDLRRDPAPTLRDLESLRIRRFLQFAEYLAEQMGRDRLIETLEDFQSKSNVEQARRAAERLGSNDFDAFKGFYNPEIPALQRAVTLEVVESTDTVYEWRITECINAEPFLAAGAADIGYASTCHVDYAFAESFNPAIKLVRDKTLMQGDEYCNHRYVWQTQE